MEMKSEFQQRATQKAETDRPNLTGIPTQMKLNFEQHSGISFDDVRVHYGSDRPAQLRALAYTQGRHVYIGPGQERYLGHELGHIIQQKLGQVVPTGRVGGLPINDDRKLEAEADHLAGLADRRAPVLEPPVQRAVADPGGEQGVVQRMRPFMHTSYSGAMNGQSSSGAQGQGTGRDRPSVILRGSLRNSGVPDPGDRVRNQAHHISETSSDLGRKILQNAGIDLNSGANGVFLPSVEDDEGGDASIHRGRHNEMYGICVAIALWNAVACRRHMTTATRENYLSVISPESISTNDEETIINVLDQIRQMLLEDNMPLNNGADGTFGQGDTTEEQIWNAFRTRRLLWPIV